jgi:hypothetical protein
MPLLVERPVFTFCVNILRYSLDTIGASLALRAVALPLAISHFFAPVMRDSFSAGMVDGDREVMLRGE